MPSTFTSKVTRVLPSSKSVRCTIPEAVAAILGVEHGSELAWTVEPGSGVVTVAKADADEPSPPSGKSARGRSKKSSKAD